MRAKPFLALLFVLALLVAACGGTDDEPEAAPDDGAATDEPAEPTDPETEPETEPEGEPEAGDDFYAGEQIRVITTWESGGLGDVYARTMARFLPNHIPGSPSIVVENMTGGGHNIGPNFLFNNAEPDGLTFGLFPSHRVVGDIVGEDGVEFDADAFTWLGSITALPGVCAAWVETSGLETFDDLLAKDASDPWILGSPSPGAIANVAGNLLADDLDLPIDVILGYEGVGDLMLAMQQGEVEGTCHGWETILDNGGEFVESGQLVPIFVAGAERLEALPDVPALPELDWSDDYAAAVDAWLARFQITVPVAAPPGVPDEQTQILRDGIAALYDDQEFVDALIGAGQIVESPMTGEEVEELVQAMFAAPERAWQIIEEAQTQQ